VLAGLTAGVLGGGRWAQVLAAVATACGPVTLAAADLANTTIYDLLAWSAIVLLVLIAVNRQRPSYWLAAGVIAGVGLENKDLPLLGALVVGLVVGIAAPSIYAHFPDLDHLKLAVVERAFASFAEARDQASAEIGDPAQALLARCRAYCRFALANPGPYRFMFSHQVPAGSPVAMAAFRALADSIAQCQKDGLSLAPDGPERLAAQVWAALHGLVILRLNAPEFPWPSPLEQMADDAVTRLVELSGGWLADQGRSDKHPTPDRSNG
jgi:AcrR family transcriptional regulator